MLAELHFDHVEAEGLGLPDEVLQRAIGGAFVAGLGERTLHHAKIREEVVAVVVHEIGVALDRVMQAVGHDEQHRAMQLLRGDERCLAGESLADLLLLVPQRAQFVARWRGLGFDGHVAADGARGLLERGEHMVAELAGHLTAHLGGDVRVAVTVGADPASRVEERRAYRRHEASLISEDPIVETTVHLWNGIEQRIVENIENGFRFLNRSRLLQCDRRGAEQRVNLVEESTGVFLLV